MAKNKEYLKIIDNYVKELKNLSNSEVVVGIPEKDNKVHQGDDNSVTVAEIGAIHEYGVPESGIPVRSFLRVPLIKNTKKIFNQIENDLKVSKIKPKKALGRLGANGRSVVLEAFNTQGGGTWKKLKPATIKARKKGRGTGTDKPLIDTEQLRKSITWEVRYDTKP
jgi:phage gpG-like protein